MDNIRSNATDNSKDANKSIKSWLGYGTVFITIFLALIVLAGRIYTQSYWNVFGLSPDLLGFNIINYSIISPNVTLSCVLITVSAILVIIVMGGTKSPDFIGDANPKIAYYLGIAIVVIGLSIILTIQYIDTSTWTPGIAGLIYGLGYLSFIVGTIYITQASLKLDTGKRAKFEVYIIRGLKSLPRIFVLGIIVIAFAVSAILAIAVTAKTFGKNEAKFMLATRPEATLILDSQKGFEDLFSVTDTGNIVIEKVGIIVKADGILYFSPGFTKEPPQILVRAIPVSRIQAIIYKVELTPLGR